MKIVIASTNPAKIEGARRAFAHYFNDFTIQGIATSSDVGEQPVNNEIFLGVKNRVKNLKLYCKNNGVNADFYIAIESGITNSLGDWMITNIALIENSQHIKSYGSSASFPVPSKFVDDIIKTELSQVINSVFDKDNERSKNGGAIKLITKDVVSRVDLTEQAFIMALTQFINPKWN